MNYEKELEFAKSMASAAGEIMKKYYRADQGVEIKTDSTPVTVADKEINDLLIERVKVEFPEHGVLGEEASWNETQDELWVCDPIDGTLAFMLHIPTAMFSLAFVIDGKPVIGLAYNPFTDELYFAQEGKGAFRNKVPINVSNKKWGKGVFLAGSSGGRSTEPTNFLQKQLLEEGVYVTNFQGTVFKGCLIAEGSLEGRTFIFTGAHDIAAIKIIIEEAGGMVTDLEGNEQRYDGKINGAIMSNGLVHDNLIDIVREVDENNRH